MTSSALARIDGGIVSPSALAVFRSMTSSKIVDSWTGKSTGLPPATIRLKCPRRAKVREGLVHS